VRARRLQAWVRNMMQPGQPRMSKSEWKRQLGSTKNLKNVKRHYKAQQKMQLQMQYERTTGDSVENWDDGKSVGRKEQVCVWDARARGKGGWGGGGTPTCLLPSHPPPHGQHDRARWLANCLAGRLADVARARACYGKARILRQQHKERQKQFVWLFRAMRGAVAVLVVWWFLLLTSFKIDAGVYQCVCRCKWRAQ
jgi:hypothetical protein